MIDPLYIRSLVNITIPGVYSDALSYQEELAVIKSKVNEIIQQLNGLTGEEIEAVISAYLTPEKIQELLDENFGAAIQESIEANNANYYDKNDTDAQIAAAISGEVADRNSAIAVEAGRAAAAELAINNELSNNYYTKAQTDAAIDAHSPDMSGYATIQDAIDIDEASMALEVTARNDAISAAITANNGSYYTKTQVDQKDAADRAYTDASVQAVQDTIDLRLAGLGWLCFSDLAGSSWTNTYNDVNAKYSEYDSGVSCDNTYLNVDFSENTSDGSREGEISIHGYFTPVSSSTINPGNTTGFLYVPFAVPHEIKVLAVIIDTSTGTALHVPMALVPTAQNDTILVYKNVNLNTTPGFSATNKRIYLDTTAHYVAAN